MRKLRPTTPAVIALLCLAAWLAPLAPVAPAQAPAPALKTRPAVKEPVAARQPLKDRLEAVLAEKDAWRAHWGIKVVSLDSGRALYSLNEHNYFTPASNTKLFTTAAALEGLGPQFKFHTTVESAAPPDKLGRIAGDVILVGRGDPNLSSRILPYRDKVERDGAPLKALDWLADQIAGEAGVRFVDGDVVADDTYFLFERFGEGWSQDDLLWSYGAPVSALSINDNLMFLEVLPGEKPGDRALVKIDPFGGFYSLENRIVTVAPRPKRADAGGGEEEAPAPRVHINREPGSRNLELWGRIPANDSGIHESLAIDDPALFAARYFRDALQSRGVMVYGQPRVRHARRLEFPDPGELRAAPYGPPPAAGAQTPPHVLASLESLPLVVDLKVINKVSQNLHAEIVLRTLGREQRGIGSVATGLEEVKAFLTRAGVPAEEYIFFDGSGLSRQNLVTPAAVVQLLTHMDKSPHRNLWLDLLPMAGVDGTLSERMKGTAAAGKVRAKTGSLGHVNALSGYATTEQGERLAFSIFVNNHRMRSRQAAMLVDRLVAALVETR